MDQHKNRLLKIYHKNFTLKGHFNTFPRNNLNNIAPLDEANEEKLSKWYNLLSIYQMYVDTGGTFLCNLCDEKSRHFNFTEYDNTFTTHERRWCIKCEEWWDTIGFDEYINYLLKKKDETTKQYLKEHNDIVDSL